MQKYVSSTFQLILFFFFNNSISCKNSVSLIFCFFWRISNFVVLFVWLSFCKLCSHFCFCGIFYHFYFCSIYFFFHMVVFTLYRAFGVLFNLIFSLWCLFLGAVELNCILICESLSWNMSWFNKIQPHWIVLGPKVTEKREPRPCDQKTSLYLLQYEGVSKYEYTRDDCSRYVQHMLYQTASLEWQEDMKLLSLIHKEHPTRCNSLSEFLLFHIVVDHFDTVIH